MPGKLPPTAGDFAGQVALRDDLASLIKRIERFQYESEPGSKMDSALSAELKIIHIAGLECLGRDSGRSDTVKLYREWRKLPIRASNIGERLRILFDAESAVATPKAPAESAAKGDTPPGAGRENTTLNARAMSLLLDHPDWKLKDFAKALNLHERTLSKPKYAGFRETRKALRRQRGLSITRGSKSKDRNVEAVDE